MESENEQKYLTIVSVFQRCDLIRNGFTIGDSYRITRSELSRSTNIIVMDLEPIKHLNKSKKEEIFLSIYGGIKHDDIDSTLKQLILEHFDGIIIKIRNNMPFESSYIEY